MALLFRIARRMYATNVMTSVTMSMAWSWRAVSCSITGEAASWSISWPHVDIVMFYLVLLFSCLKIAIVSRCVWKAGGKAGCCHSRLVFMYSPNTTPRSAMKVSHRIKMKSRREVNESIEPQDETEFHRA